MVEREWLDEFHQRMDRFHRTARGDGIAISIKLRAERGNFDHYGFPDLYPSLNAVLRQRKSDDIAIQEHESGPEWLIYLVVTASVLNLIKPMIELITVALKAREKPRKNDGGVRKAPPLVLIVRRLDDEQIYRQRIVCRIEPDQTIKTVDLEAELEAAIEEIAANRVRKSPQSDIIKRPAIDSKPKPGPKKKNTRKKS